MDIVEARDAQREGVLVSSLAGDFAGRIVRESEEGVFVVEREVPIGRRRAEGARPAGVKTRPETRDFPADDLQRVPSQV